MKYVWIGVPVILMGCSAPTPKMSLEDAQIACRADVSQPVKTKARVGVGIGSGGEVKTKAGVSVGIDLSAASNPQQAYENCVRRNSGLAPVEPL